MVRNRRKYIKEEDLAAEVERFYNIGKIKKCMKLHLGYDDCNYLLETANRKFICKVFANEKDSRYGNRYVKIVNDSQLMGVRHPVIINSKEGQLANIKGRPSLVNLGL